MRASAKLICGACVALGVVSVLADYASEIDFKAASEMRFGTPAQAVTEPIELRLSPGAWIDRAFWLSQGQHAVMTFVAKANRACQDDLATWEKQEMRLVFDLPKGVTLEAVSQGKIASTRATAGGTHVECVLDPDEARIICRQFDDFYWWRRLGYLVTTDAPAGSDLGEATVVVMTGGKRLSNIETFRFRTLARISAPTPKRMLIGCSDGGIYGDFAADGWRKWMTSCREAGMNAFEHDTRNRALRRTQLAIQREVGFDCVLTTHALGSGPYDGYLVGLPGAPAEDRFVTLPEIYEKSNAEKRSRFDRAVCPSSVYERRPFFMTNTVPAYAAIYGGWDGVWANWEPFTFMGRGCFCTTCRGKFAAFSGLSAAEMDESWPQEMVRDGRHAARFLDFASREHGKMVNVIREELAKVCGGGRVTPGFIVGPAWCEMASVWRTKPYAPGVRPIDYAADFDWISPWGPYAIWMSQQPYVYSKWRNLRTFLAARDVRRQVDLDYPLPKRPKLMAFCHGLQLDDWLIRPEALELNLDSFFFNGWQAVSAYRFPKGLDQRWWAAIARSAEKMSRYEDFTFDGRREAESVRTKRLLDEWRTRLEKEVAADAHPLSPERVM